LGHGVTGNRMNIKTQDETGFLGKGELIYGGTV